MSFINRWGVVLMLFNGPVLAASVNAHSYVAAGFAGFGFLCGAFCFLSPPTGAEGKTE